MANFFITHIRMSNPSGSHEAITHLFGPKQEEPHHMYVDLMPRVCGYVATRNHRFYMEKDGVKLFTGIRQTADGRSVLQTYVDERWTDDLLSLPHKTPEEYSITTIRRSEPNGGHESITHVTYPDFVEGQPDYVKPIFLALDYVEHEKYIFRVEVDGVTSDIAVRTSDDGRKYMQAHIDGVWNNSLLALPEG
jgi:hypothetical protein